MDILPKETGKYDFVWVKTETHGITVCL